MLSIDRRLLKLAELADLPESAGESQRAALGRLREIELHVCALDVVYWFNTWVWTYNPKLVGARDPWLPMDLFPRQEELVRWLLERSEYGEDGHCVKSRDIGFTWCCGGFALNKWLFQDGYKANFGSRKAEYVDKLGDPDSILEKIRMLLRGLPHWMRPRSFADNHMLLVNNDRGSIIRGEAGDDMGRGGRSTDAFYDEFAFVANQDSVDAASSANAECRIFGSTVNGNNNLFYSMQAGDRFREDQKFRFHWSDDPRKRDGVVQKPDGTVESWEKAERRRMEPWKFASEYDCDFTASVEGICIPALWVEASKKLRALVHYEPPVRGVVGGDVGGDGSAKSVAVARFGALVRVPRSWSHGDTIRTARDMLAYCADQKFKRKDGHLCEARALNYDSVGVGKGTQDALKGQRTGVVTHGVNTGVPPSDYKWPDGETSKEKFLNLKAEIWWIGRARFKKSYEKVLWIEGDQENGYDHPIEDCIILPGDREGSDATTLATQLSSVKVDTDAESGKIVIQSKKSLKKDGVPSPDHAEALMNTFAPTSSVEVWLKAFGKAN